MTPSPEVKPLSYTRRQSLLWTLFLVFVVLLPILMFYATGYRFNLGDKDGNIVSSTGGLYVSAPYSDIDIFVDEESVRDLRVFRQASYIQNLDEGIHRLNVQRDDLQTWTKDLPVYPHIVTEAQSFNLPRVPHVRVITPYVTVNGASVMTGSTSAESFLSSATTTNELFFATSTATSSYLRNPEYVFVTSLFVTTSTSSDTLIRRVVGQVEDAFTFVTSIATTSSTTATTTRIFSDMKLYESGKEVYAEWDGTLSSIPYYFCVDHEEASTTIERYGEHVYESIRDILASSSHENILHQNNRVRVCRDAIRIDRKQQDVYDFDFFPDSVDLVLMLLDDGLYVVEIDDRAWQNTQLLYPGEDLHMRVDGGNIYVFDGEQYFEVLTELE